MALARLLHVYKDKPWLRAVLDSTKNYDEALFDLARGPWEIEPAVFEATSDSKWLLASAMQKSIRHGHPDLAYRYALKLTNIDDGYVWRRLAIIALEDVGIGGLVETAFACYMARNKSARSLLGKERALWLVTHLLSTAAKSRLATHLLILWMKKEPQDKAFTDLVALGPSLMNQHGRLGTLVSWIGDMASLIMQEDFDRSLPASVHLAAGDEELRLMTRSMPVVKIDGILQESYDQYTQEGKRALAYFGKACEPVAAFMTERGCKKTLNALGMAAFHGEGGVLNKEVEFGSQRAARLREIEVDFGGSFTNVDDALAFTKLVRDNRASLYKARVRIVTGEKL